MIGMTAGGACIVVDVCVTGRRVAMQGGDGSARPWLTGNDPRGSKISNLTRASRRGGPPTRAPPDYCGGSKPGTIFPVSATVLEPQGGDLTKPRPTAWVSGTPTDTRALKGRDNQSQTYRSSKAIPCASSDCGVVEHLFRPFRAGVRIGGLSKPRPLAWASLFRPFGAEQVARPQG